MRGLNVIGLKRSGFEESVVKSITRAFMFLFKGKTDHLYNFTTYDYEQIMALYE